MSPVCRSSFLYSTSSSGWLHTPTCVGYTSRMKDWGVATTRSTLTCQIMCPKQGLLHQEKGEALWCAHGAGCSQSHVPLELPPNPGRVVFQFVTNVLCLLLIFSLFSSSRPRYPLTVTRHCCYWWFFRHDFDYGPLSVSRKNFWAYSPDMDIDIYMALMYVLCVLQNTWINIREIKIKWTQFSVFYPT